MTKTLNANAVMALATALLLHGGAPPETPVADAAMRGDAAEVRALVRAGADVNAAQGDGMTALHWAAERGHGEVAEVVLAAGANPEALTRLGDYTPLHIAARNGSADVARALLRAGADPEARTSTERGASRWWRSCSSGGWRSTRLSLCGSRRRSCSRRRAGTPRSCGP